MSEVDPKLSRVYREASTEGPPAAVDAAILAAARKHAAGAGRRERSQPKGRSRSFWSRWMVPASVAATLALGVSLALLVERERPEVVDDTAIRPAPPQPQSLPRAPATESTKAKPADRAPSVAAAKKEAPAAAAPPQSPEAALPAPIAPTQAPAATLRAPARAQVPQPGEPAPSAAQAFPDDSRAKASAPSAAAPRAETNTNAAIDAAAGGPGTAGPAARAGKLAPLRQQEFQRSAQAWLDEIGRLKRDGRDKEAAEQLAEFRKAYPAHAVPEELLQ